MLTNPPRSLSRASWKALHRLLRIAARESAKALTDQMIYGTGFIRLDPATAEARHVPYEQVAIAVRAG